MRRVHGQAGFTLAEALLATAILAIAVAGVSQAIVAGQMQSREAMHAHRAVTLGEATIERVLALPYHDPDGGSDPGAESGEVRVSDFDNADDYDGYEEPAGRIADPSGEPWPETYQRFSRAVSASYTEREIAGLGDPQPGLRVTVTVRNEGGRRWSMSRFVPEPTDASDE